MKEDKVVYAMALLAVLSVAGLLLFELALSPKARYPLTVTRVQQVQQVLRGEEVQQGEGVLVQRAAASPIWMSCWRSRASERRRWPG